MSFVAAKIQQKCTGTGNYNSKATRQGIICGHEFTWKYILLKLFLPEKRLQRTFIELHLLKFNFPQPLVKHEVFVEFKSRKLEDDGKHAG